MKKELTKEEIALMHTTRQEWLDAAFTYSPIDQEKASRGVDWLYRLAGLEPPKLKIYLSSPMAIQLAIPILKNILSAGRMAQVWAQVRAQVGGQVWDQVEDQVEDQVGAQVGAQVGDQVRDQVRDQVWDQVWAQVGDQVWDQVRAQVRAQVWAQAGAQVGDQVGDQVEAQYTHFGSYGNFSDYAWVANYFYFSRIGIVNHDNFNKFVEFLSSGIFSNIQLNGVFLACEKPVKIIRNERGQLHNPSGPCIEWKDGYKLYAINGRMLPAWIWEKEITKEMFLSERNAEIKGGMYAVLGQKKVFEMLDCEMVKREQRNGETLELYKTRKPIDGKILAWVKCTCPSTNTRYMLGVRPEHTSPVEAMASLWGVETKEYFINQHT